MFLKNLFGARSGSTHACELRKTVAELTARVETLEAYQRDKKGGAADNKDNTGTSSGSGYGGMSFGEAGRAKGGLVSQMKRSGLASKK